MKTKTLIVLSLFCAGFMACKKTETSANTNQQKMIGKWTFQQVIANDFYSGASHVTTYPGDPGDYFDFRADGKVYFRAWGSYDTSTYTMINETQVRMDPGADTSDIILLTNSAMQLYQKQVYAPGDYSESTLYLQK